MRNEINHVSHLVMLLTMTVFSGVLIVLNRLLDWEIWMIPVVAAGTVLSISLHIAEKGSPRTRCYCYGLFMIFEVFYYTVNINTLSDSTALIVIMVFIFSMTGERLLSGIGGVCGLAGMALHIVMTGQQGLLLDASSLIRAVWQFVLIVLGAVLADRMSALWIQMEKNYQKRIQDIQEENERANNFLANVSHEIRTPLGVIMGLTAITEQEQLSDSVRGNLRSIADAGHRVADQIADIMDYTEIDMNRLTVSSDRYMITSVVNDLLSELRYSDESKLDLVLDLDPLVPAELTGDASKIKKILWHLITNGLKFTRSGGVCVRIYAKHRDYGINLVMEITDTGAGMTEQELERVYEKFYQSDSGRSRAAGGLGLGIPIVDGFAGAMNGFLHLESTPGDGMTARVSIPQEVADPAPCIAVTDKEHVFAAGFLGFQTTSDQRVKNFYMEMIEHLVAGLGIVFHRVISREELEKLIGKCHITHLFVGTGEYLDHKAYIDSLVSTLHVILVEDRNFTGTIGSEIARLSKPFSGMQVAHYLNSFAFASDTPDRGRMTCPGVRVLVVDDDPMNLLVARGIFETYGMLVSTAESGPASVSMCRNEAFDIIFMDHMMPGMDGVEAMKQLRQEAEKRGQTLCIVALTANASSSAKEMFLSEGFDAFLPKPIELLELERILRAILPEQSIVYESQKPQTPAPQEVKPSDRFCDLREYGVDVEAGIRYCQNEEAFYLRVLAEYGKDAENKLDTLDRLLREQNWKEYAVRVHAVKSTSKMIGAEALSEQAKALEAAAKAGDGDTVTEQHAAFRDDYGRLLELIGSLTGEPSASDGTALEFAPSGSSSEDDEVMEFAPGGSTL